VKRVGDFVASLFGILLSGTVMIGAYRLRLGTPMEPQPGFFPFLAGGVLFVLCVILLLQVFFGRSHGAEAFGELWRPVVLIIGLFAYSVVLDLLGYIIAMIILSAVVLRVLGVKIGWKLVAISVGLSVGTYVLFDHLLDLSLPAGILAGFN
jgi:putative tricarboxylic transport membrane protein